MTNIKLMQAGEGDCIWMEYGESEESLHRVLIDGGTTSTAKRLKKLIDQLPADQRYFDLMVITHIDADHIAGILKLIEDNKLDLAFSDIWFNGYRHLEGPAVKGVKQGERLSRYLERSDIPWNKAFDGEAVCVDAREGYRPIELPGGMKLTLLSPNKEALSNLKPHWEEEAKKAGLFLDQPSVDKEDLDTRPLAPKSLARITLPDIDSLVKTPFDPDTSLTNGSSIAFIAEYDGKKMLFTGDAYATILLDSIQSYLPDEETLHLDLFKVPHHGSDGNISKKLLERIQCSNYLISTNGARHQHPDKAAIAKIIKFGGDKPDLYFNYLSRYNEIWHTPALLERYDYTVHYPANDQADITLKIRE